MGACSALPFPVVHEQLLGLADIEGEVVVLAPHCEVSDLIPIGYRHQAYLHFLNSNLNEGVGVVCGHAVMGEQGVHTPLRDPRVDVAWRRCCFLPSPPGGSPSESPGPSRKGILSLVMSLEGTMGLNAEL